MCWNEQILKQPQTAFQNTNIENLFSQSFIRVSSGFQRTRGLHMLWNPVNGIHAFAHHPINLGHIYHMHEVASVCEALYECRGFGFPSSLILHSVLSEMSVCRSCDMVLLEQCENHWSCVVNYCVWWNWYIAWQHCLLCRHCIVISGHHI
jgi:hypothetical protein